MYKVRDYLGEMKRIVEEGNCGLRSMAKTLMQKHPDIGLSHGLLITAYRAWTSPQDLRTAQEHRGILALIDKENSYETIKPTGKWETISPGDSRYTNRFKA